MHGGEVGKRDPAGGVAASGQDFDEKPGLAGGRIDFKNALLDVLEVGVVAANHHGFVRAIEDLKSRGRRRRNLTGARGEGECQEQEQEKCDPHG